MSARDPNAMFLMVVVIGGVGALVIATLAMRVYVPALLRGDVALWPIVAVIGGGAGVVVSLVRVFRMESMSFALAGASVVCAMIGLRAMPAQLARLRRTPR